MTDYEVQSFMAARGHPEEDIRPAERVDWEALDQERVNKFFAALRERRPHAKHLNQPEAALLQVYKIAVRSASGPAGAPSLAGLLMFGKHPQGEFPNLCITVVRYSGTIKAGSRDGAQIIENQKIEGTLPEMLENTLDVIRRNMRRRTIKAGLISEEIMEYPELAIREILVNAVGHRDYGPGARGSQVQVKMYSDGLVVQSPGGLFGPVTEETLGEAGVQASRNAHLMRMLEEIGLAESRGSGIRTISEQLAKAHLPPPRFEDGRTYFRVTFSNESLLDEAMLVWLNQFAGFPLNEGQRLALALLKKQPTIRNLDYSRLNRCDSRLATADLAGLRELGLIKQLGSRRGAVYELAPAFIEAAVLPKMAGWKTRHRTVFGFVKKMNTANIKQIVEGCDLSIPYARVTVGELIKMGALEGTEKNRNSPKQSYRIRNRPTPNHGL
jgi:ATP-dependent DNA helicase RecG